MTTTITTESTLQHKSFYWPQRTSTAFEQARAVLEPVFIQISDGAPHRETQGRLAHEAIHQLRDAGYTRLRVPQAYGGFGLTFEEASWFLVALGQADSNLAQALRAHWLNLENLLSLPLIPANEAFIDRWLTRIGQGAIVGNAITERNNVHGKLNTVLTTTTDESGNPVHRLDGTKYYCTGTTYADWLLVSATKTTGEIIRFLTQVDAPGVTVLDDWDGFGQQLTASGTTTFDNTPVPAEEITHAEQDPENGAVFANGQAMAQYVHLATLLGIGHAVVQDAAQYARHRTRSFSHGNTDLPKHDPQVLQVVGEISAETAAARAAFATLLPDLALHLQADALGQRVDQQDVNKLYVAVYQAQHVVSKTVLASATKLFEIGGASATSQTKALDRHWRNARVLASHNPIMYRNRMIGDWEINRTPVGQRYTVGTTQPKEQS